MNETVTADSGKRPASSSSVAKKITALVLVAVILGLILWNTPFLAQIFGRIFGFNQFPKYAHDELVDYALSLINSDRSRSGLTNVSLGLVYSGQQHADDMLGHHYLSHWDTNGYKPYARYTLAGGRGFVEENIAWYYSGSGFDAEAVLKDLEWQMMNNDSESNLGHMHNILNPSHDKVSVGVALDADNLYLVQDFENDYTQWSTFDVSTDAEATMVGTLEGINQQVKQVGIFYDNPPSNLTSEQLQQPPYNGAYTLGTFVGLVLPPGYRSTNGMTITAETWNQSGQALDIKFNLSPAFTSHGKGIYTLYLQATANTEDALTSYSVFYS